MSRYRGTFNRSAWQRFEDSCRVSFNMSGLESILIGLALAGLLAAFVGLVLLESGAVR